ncbi:hypothetical protein [Ekhidna sp.]
MRITKKLLIISLAISFVIVFGCSSETESKNSIKTENIGDSVLVKLFYDNEYPKYIGSVYKNLKHGIHKEFSETDSGKVVAAMKFSNDILNSIVYYTEEGQEVYNSKTTNSRIVFEPDVFEVFAGDTLSVFLKFEESNYDFLSFFPDDFTNSYDFVSGVNSIQGNGTGVRLNYISYEVGKDTIRGYLIENTYELFNDSMSTHIGFHKYFEYPIEVKVKSKI